MIAVQFIDVCVTVPAAGHSTTFRVASIFPYNYFERNLVWCTCPDAISFDSVSFKWLL